MTEELIAAPKQTLLEIADTLSALFEVLESANGPDEFLAADTEIRRVVEVDLSAKVDAIGWLDRRADLEVAGLQDLIKDIESKIGVINKRKKRLRDFVQYAMGKMDTRKIKGQVTTISIRDGVESLDITDETKIPDPYITTETIQVVNIDKKRLKEDLKSGSVIPGAELKRGADILTVR